MLLHACEHLFNTYGSISYVLGIGISRIQIYMQSFYKTMRRIDARAAYTYSDKLLCLCLSKGGVQRVTSQGRQNAWELARPMYLREVKIKGLIYAKTRKWENSVYCRNCIVLENSVSTKKRSHRHKREKKIRDMFALVLYDYRRLVYLFPIWQFGMLLISASRDL